MTMLKIDFLMNEGLGVMSAPFSWTNDDEELAVTRRMRQDAARV